MHKTETPKELRTIEHGSLLDAVLAETRLSRNDAAYAQTRRAVEGVLSAVLSEDEYGAREIDRPLIDVMIADIEERISAQVNEILHDTRFQGLESAWRSLEFMVDRIDFDQNVVLEVLHVSKEELQRDFDDAPELPSSGLFRVVHSREYGVYGGKPYGLITANYEVGPTPRDMQLLRQCAAVSAMAHCIFVANANPRFFGLNDFSGLPSLGDLRALHQSGPQYEVWRTFRRSEDARYVGLCLPRFLLRRPYREGTATRVRTFAFDEDVEGRHERYLWGYASAAFATRVADSFARYRWCPNIIGPTSGGAVERMVLEPYAAMGRLQSKISTEAIVTDRREVELAELGFIPLVHRKPEEDACFFSASSTHKPDRASTDEQLGAQLPYMFVIVRLAHYIKAMERDVIATSRSASDVQRELTDWLRQYISDIDDARTEVRVRRPLRQASISVSEAPGEPGWYDCRILVRPHFKYMGASFTLSLLGKIDRKGG